MLSIKRIVSAVLCSLMLLSGVACADSADTTDASTREESRGESDVLNDGDTNTAAEEQTEAATSSAETVGVTQTVTGDITSSAVVTEVSTDPVTNAPQTSAPVTQAPVTQAPVTQAPETEAPVTLSPPKPPERTQTPKIIATANWAVDRITIYGSTEYGSVITSYGSNGVKFEDKACGTYFYIEANTSSVETIRIYATAPYKKPSEEVSVTVRAQITDQKAVFGGRNSRLFYHPTLSFFLGNVQTTDSILASARETLRARADKIQSLTGKDTKLIYILVPNPATIYYDEMYDYIASAAQYKQLDTAAWQFVKYMNGAGKSVNIIVPDLYALFNKLKDEMIYFRTDTHWTELGAYYAYAEMMNYVDNMFHEAKAHPLSDYDVVYQDCAGGDMCGMLGLSLREVTPFLLAKFTGTGDFYTKKRDAGYITAGIPVHTYPTISTVNNSRLPTSYFIGDSYGAYFLPFAGAGFKTMTTNEGVLWNYTIDYVKIAREKPDYVIFCYTDRNIDSTLYQITRDA